MRIIPLSNLQTENNFLVFLFLLNDEKYAYFSTIGEFFVLSFYGCYNLRLLQANRRPLVAEIRISSENVKTCLKINFWN